MTCRISTNRFYAEKPMGGFYRLTDTCVISSAIGMDKMLVSHLSPRVNNYLQWRFYTSVKHQVCVTDNNWTYFIRRGSNFSAYGCKIRTYITPIRPLTEALCVGVFTLYIWAEFVMDRLYYVPSQFGKPLLVQRGFLCTVIIMHVIYI